MEEYKKVNQADEEEQVALATEVVASTKQEAPEVAAEDVEVCVVAPCALPPKYRLSVVTTQGDEFDVFVPHRGVQEGEEFTSTKVPVKPWTGRFSDGLLDCGNGEGPTIFALGCMCPDIVYAAIMEKLNLSELGGPSGNPSGKPTFWIVSVISIVSFVTQMIEFTTEVDIIPGWIHLLNYGSFIFLMIALTRARMSFRERYSIEGNCFMDLLMWFLCGCCASLQMYRHMQRSGERPTRFLHIKAEATIV